MACRAGHAGPFVIKTITPRKNRRVKFRFTGAFLGDDVNNAADGGIAVKNIPRDTVFIEPPVV